MHVGACNMVTNEFAFIDRSCSRFSLSNKKDKSVKGYQHNFNDKILYKHPRSLRQLRNMTWNKHH